MLGRPPNGIYKVLVNDLPRPRSGPTTRTTELFWEYKKQLIKDISKVAGSETGELEDNNTDSNNSSSGILQEATL